MRFGFLVSSIAIALFGIFSYYAGWRHGSHSAVRAAPIEPLQAEPIRAQVNDDLIRRNLVMPIAGVNLRDIHDTFNEGRAHGKPHEATDILAPKGTPVLAMDDGTIRKLFTSVPGGLTIYQFDPQEIYCYYYAHLDHYLLGLREGDHVRRGEIIGFVGVTGNAPPNTPHLHLAIFELGPEKHWWQGTPVNPYPLLLRLVGE